MKWQVEKVQEDIITYKPNYKQTIWQVDILVSRQNGKLTSHEVDKTKMIFQVESIASRQNCKLTN